MRLKFADASADEGFTEIFCKSLNLKGQGDVLEERPGMLRGLRDRALRAAGVPVAERRPQLLAERAVEQDALSEMLEEMSLSTLLYYVLAGEGTEADEPA